MILITPAQCRAARALLDWSQPDLAERCGIHVQTISAFEKEDGSPTKTTLHKIVQALEFSGIEFMPNNGVCLAKNKMYVTENYCDILDDVLRTLAPGEEVLFHCADDRRSPPAVDAKLLELEESGIKMRCTTWQGNTKMRKGRSYRTLPQDYYGDAEVSVIYADKFVIHVDGYGEKSEFLTIKNKNLAHSMRRQFEYWWKNGKAASSS